MPIELNFDDIKGLAKTGAGALTPKAVGGLGEAAGGQDIMQGINGLLDRVNTTMTSFKEMIGLVKGIMPGGMMSGLGGPGRGSAPGQIYQPPASLAQQLHQVVNVAYTVYGDITITELLQAALQQYGNTKLSAVLKALQGF